MASKQRTHGNGVSEDSKGSVRTTPGEKQAKDKRRGVTSAESPRSQPGGPARGTRPDPQALNVIRASRPRTRGSRDSAEATPALRAEAKTPAAGQKQSAEKEASTARRAALVPSSDPWALPQSVRDRFVQVRKRFYFPDGTEAFRDRGQRLTTASENTEVVRTLIEIARARGWREITVEGSERFRREAWRQATLAELGVRGYRATAPERAAMVRTLARRAQGRQLELDVSDAAAGSRHPGERTEQLESGVREGSSFHSAGGARRRELIVGKLIDHGRENYRFDPREPLSYFVKLETAEGRRTIWGKDLERAIGHSLTQPKIGDEVALRRTGADKVTVHRRERDAEGRVIGERERGAERNRWVVEQREFFASRAAAAEVVRDPRIDRRQAARQHPELVGTLLQLRAAELAARRIRDPQDQKRFVALVRGALADSVARGDPLQPVRLRERSVRAPERAAKERDMEPVRS